jgi:electron transport complex protein RnfB
MKEHDLYRKLRRHLDSAPIPLPASPSGAELRLLEHLFTPREAEIALALSLVAEPLEKIQPRLKKLGLPTAELRRILDQMVKKGSISGGLAAYGGKTVPAYGKAFLVIGMFEWQVDHLTTEFVEDFHTYLEESFAKAVFKQKTSQTRTVPINAQVVSGAAIGRYDDIRRYIEGSRGPFGVMNCICRQARELLGESCSYSSNQETCLSIGPTALWLRRQGHARLIKKQEFLDLLDRAESEGLVLQPQNTQTPGYICCCCPDCCEVLLNVGKFPRPVDYFDPNYQAAVDEDLCTGCKVCEKRCPINAVTVTDKKARVNPNRCIGCGLCVVKCKAEAITLKPLNRRTVPPADSKALYTKILFQRFGPLRILGKAAGMMTGRQF